MSALDVDIANDLQLAARSMEMFQAGLRAYQANIVRAFWKAADEERANLHDALDKHLDAFGAAHKRLEEARREIDRA